MATKNDITGDYLISKASTEEYNRNFDKIFTCDYLIEGLNVDGEAFSSTETGSSLVEVRKKFLKKFEDCHRILKIQKIGEFA